MLTKTMTDGDLECTVTISDSDEQWKGFILRDGHIVDTALGTGSDLKIDQTLKGYLKMYKKHSGMTRSKK